MLIVDAVALCAQTGKLLDILPGHQGPISALAFSSGQSLVASASWDKTVRLWDPYAGKGQIESLSHVRGCVTTITLPRV